MDCSELLQTSHLSKAEHGAFSSSKRQVGILRPIVTPAARPAKDVAPRHVAAQSVRGQHISAAVVVGCTAESPLARRLMRAYRVSVRQI